MEECHIESAYKLLGEYLKKFDLAPIYEKDDFRHFFLPQDNVIYSYVIEVNYLKIQSH